METGYSCSDECGCEHCHRIQAAYDAQAARLAALEQVVFTHEWHVSCCPALIRALDDVLADDYKEEAP